jgi:hypothetical protein
MIVVHHNGVAQRVHVGQSLVGHRIKSFTIDAHDALHPDLADWLREVVLPHMDLPK